MCRLVQLPVAGGPVGTGQVDGVARQGIAPLQEPAQQGHEVVDVEVRYGEVAVASQDPGHTPPPQPLLQQDVERSVLAPVAEDGGEADDRPRQRRRRLPDQLFAPPLADGVGNLGVRWCRLVDDPVPGREAAGGNAAGEDEPRGAEVPGTVEHQPRAADVRPLVLGMVTAGEIVVSRQVEDDIDAPGSGDPLPDPGHLLGLGDIDQQPGDVGVRGDSHLAAGPARQGVDPVLVPQGRQQVAADETGRTGEQQAGPRSGQHCASGSGRTVLLSR